MRTKIKIGIDEAGRGPWAGPVVACAIAWNSNNMPEKSLISACNDSKKISAKKREELYGNIITLANEWKLFFGVWSVDNFLIDELGIKKANREAMRRAIVEITRKIPAHFEHISVVIDGKDNYEFEELVEKPLYIVGWDGKVPEISAASIVAKVFRDKLMTQYATLYPHFGFENNAGYGTKKHQEQLQKREDITGIHRQSYAPVKKVHDSKEKCLVHICCGPDATVPLMDLKHDYEVIAYWYDPNIQPLAEHEKRFDAFVKVCEIEGVAYIKGDYDVKNFFSKIKGFEDTPERGEKCTLCYDMRLERTAQLAREMGIKKWTSSLNNSPHKDVEKMFKLGEKWDEKLSALHHPLSENEQNQAAEILGISREQYLDQIKKYEQTSFGEKLDFLKIAFRKNWGFQRSVDYTHEHDIYRQNYCGCVYSDTFPWNPKNKGKKAEFSW